MALPKSDNYNRANQVLVGNGYAEVQTGAGNNMAVLSNVASWDGTNTLGGDHCVRDSDNTYNADHKATMTIADLTSGSSFQRIGPAVRCSLSVASYNAYRVRSKTGGDSGFEWQIIEVVSGGAATVLASSTSTFDYTVGDILSLEVSGTTLTAKLNGSTVATATSSLSGGAAGIHSRNLDGIAIDDAVFDNLAAATGFVSLANKGGVIKNLTSGGLCGRSAGGIVLPRRKIILPPSMVFTGRNKFSEARL